MASNIDDPAGFNHRFVEVNGVRLHVVDEGDGPLLILLHGFPFLWYLWRHQIKALAAAGYRVIAPDQRGYGQSAQPFGLTSYDITRLVGDVIGLIQESGAPSAVVVGQDWGSPITYFTGLMRPDIVRAVVMMCSPPDPWSPVKPSQRRGTSLEYAHLNFYQEYLARPTTPHEIMSDLRAFLAGIFYSTSGSCTDAEQWRWVWTDKETFFDTLTVPKTLPAYLSQQALDYYVDQFSRSGIAGAAAWYAAIESDWEARAFLAGAVAHQPALFLYGERDPSLKVLNGIDRQGPAFAALHTTFSNMKDVIKLSGVGHTPPEEKPDEVNEILLKFLRSL